MSLIVPETGDDEGHAERGIGEVILRVLLNLEMMVQDIVSKPEKITLQDGRSGFFFQEKPDTKSTVIVRRNNKATSKSPSSKLKSKSKVGQSIINSLLEVKIRKSSEYYPLKGFDKLMDDL